MPSPSTFLSSLSRHWQWFALRGVVAVLLGVIAIAWPGPTLLAFVFVWGVYAIADGVLSLIVAFRARSRGQPAWPLVLAGATGILAGLAAELWTDVTVLVLLFMIAGWALVIGAAQIVAAVRLRREVDNEWLLIASGAISIAFGIILLWRTDVGARLLVSLVGGYSILFGSVLLILAERLRRHVHRPAHA
jgi:uncharacterized membrane protein HdeD (DUF308 family)